MNPIRIELPTEFDVGPVNSYLFVEPEPVLIDTGVASDASWSALTSGLAEHGLAIQDIQRVIITHPHIDHFGQAKRILDESDAQVWIADIGKDWLTQPEKMWQGRMDYYGSYFLPQVGIPAEMQQLVLLHYKSVMQGSPPIAEDNLTVFRVGDQLQMGGLAWDVLYMPGHASTQTCFYQPDTRQFISADMLLPKTPTPIVEQPADGKTREPSLPLFLDSLARVEALEIDTVYPGHGEIFGEHRTLIAQQRARIEQRKEETFALVEQGHGVPIELTNVMYSHYPPKFRFAGLWMLLGYLDLLEMEGRVTVRVREDGVLWYTAVS